MLPVTKLWNKLKVRSGCLYFSSADNYANLETQESELESEIQQKYSCSYNVINNATVEIWVLGNYLSSGGSVSTFTEDRSIIWKTDLKYQQ